MSARHSDKQVQARTRDQGQRDSVRPSPGKAPRTGRVDAPGAVQRKLAPTGPSAAAEPVKSANEWTRDPRMMAAHGFVSDTRAVQGKGEMGGADIHAAASAGVSGSGGALPHLDTIQSAFGGHDVSGVQAHVGGKAADAAGSIGAVAYATGNDIAFAQTPDLHTAAHEAAHVIQQRGGVQLADGVGQSGDHYEQHADRVADAVVRGDSAEGLLDQMSGGAGAVQRKQEDGPVQRLDEGDGGATPEQRQAAQSLGQINRFDDSFYGRAGAVLEAAVPRGGDKAKVQINVNLPVNANVSISFGFITEAENAQPNFKAKCEVQAGITGKVDLWLVEAFAQAKAVGYLEAQGDSGAEVFRFLAFGLYDRVAQVSRRAADFVWGDTFGATTRGQMQGDDYIESGVGVEVSAGVSGGGDGVGAGLRVTGGQRVSNGGQTRENFGMVQGTLSFSASPFSGEVQVKLGSRGGVEEIEFGISGERFISAADFMAELTGGSFSTLMIDYVGRAIGAVQNVVMGQSGLTQDRSQAQRVGAVLRTARDASVGMNVGGAAGVAAAQQSLAASGVALNGGFGQKLTVKIGAVGSQGSVGIDLERVGRLEIGENPRSPVYVMLENVSRILHVPPITFSV
ncbi:DUF4157 domain-containing protein [Haliangium sp.]|uniref:eCIS core domain-containing protein n=1 Tax=Haliangium sp. TaxID=2663208 RepID=UPI003D0CA015